MMPDEQIKMLDLAVKPFELSKQNLNEKHSGETENLNLGNYKTKEKWMKVQRKQEFTEVSDAEIRMEIQKACIKGLKDTNKNRNRYEALKEKEDESNST